LPQVLYTVHVGHIIVGGIMQGVKNYMRISKARVTTVTLQAICTPILPAATWQQTNNETTKTPEAAEAKRSPRHNESLDRWKSITLSGCVKRGGEERP